MKPSLRKRSTSNCQSEEVNSFKDKLEDQSILKKLGVVGEFLIVLGNFLWMFGFMFCVQAFLNINNSGFVGALDSTLMWKTLKLGLNLSPTELALFAGAVAFALSALVHQIHIFIQLLSHKTT